MGNNYQVVNKDETEAIEMEANSSSQEQTFSQNFISKSRIGMDLIRMRVKVMYFF